MSRHTEREFGTLATILRWVDGVLVVFANDVPCNKLFWAGNRQMGSFGYSGGVDRAAQIDFPAGTDVRGSDQTGGASDLVRCPAGTEAVYRVDHVDDVYKGFAGEFRRCTCFRVNAPTDGPLE